MTTDSASNPSRFLPLWHAVLLAFLFRAGSAVEAAPDLTAHATAPRNLVLISIDTLRADELGCYGYARQTSPVLDALANRGRIFTQVFAAAAITAPSHMSMFTSQYPFEHGVGYDQEGLRSASTYTLAEVLRLHGYQTAAFVGLSGPDFWFGPKYGFAKGFLLWTFPHTFFTPNEQVWEWLNNRQRDTPFFLFLHAWDVHQPHLVTQGFDARRFDPGYAGPVPGTWEELRHRKGIPSSADVGALTREELLTKPARDVEGRYYKRSE